MNIYQFYRVMSRLNSQIKGRPVDRRKLMKTGLAGAGLSVYGSMLAACTPDDADDAFEDPADDDGADDTAADDTAAPDDDEPVDDDADDAAEEPVEDRDYTGQLGLLIGSHMEPFPTLVEQYNDEHGVEANTEEITTPDLQTVLTGAFIARDSPWDAVFLTADLVANIAEQGWLEEMDDFIQQVRDSGEGEFLEGGLAAAEHNGHWWAVPWTLGAPILHWNRNLFEEFGLDPDAPRAWHETQNSWDEFVEYAQEMTGELNGRQIYGITSAWAEDAVLRDWGAVLQMLGGRWFDDDGQPAFNDEAGVEATEKLYDLLHTYECIDPAVRTYTWVFDASPGYLDGSRAMFLTWPFIGGVANFEGDSEIQGYSEAAPYPAIETSASTDGSEFFGIPVYAQNQDEAWRFLEKMMSRDGQRTIAETGWAPVYSDLMEEDDLLEDYPFYTAIKQSYEYPVEFGFSPDRSIWADLLANEIHEALAGNKSPQEALDDAAQRIIEDREDS
jgi:multiple sugar transport system substrate-binding protein